MIFGLWIWIDMILGQANLAFSIIGWIQFGLLSITIGVPALILITPLKYDLKGVLHEAKEFPDEENEEENEESDGPGAMIKKMVMDVIMKITDPIQGNGRFSWLFGLIKGEFFYKDRELSWKAKILIKRLSSEDEKDEREKEDASSKEIKKGEKDNAGKSQTQATKETHLVTKGNEAIRRMPDLPEVKVSEKLEEDLWPTVAISQEEEPDEMIVELEDLSEKTSADIENLTEKKVSASVENPSEKKVSASVEEDLWPEKGGASLESRSEKKIDASAEDELWSEWTSENPEDPKEKKVNPAQEAKVEGAQAHKEQRSYTAEGETKEDDRSFFEKADDFFDRMEEGVDTISEKMEYTYEQICDKIDLVSDGKEKITDFINDETHQGAYRKLIKELKQLWAAVKPSKIKGSLKVGFENPRTTGMFIAGASLVHPYLGNNANLEADFDNEALEGDLRIRGKLRIGSLAWFATKMAINKDVQMTVKDIMKLVPKKGGK